MKHLLYILFIFGYSQSLWSQSNPSAIFELESTDQGILIPRTDTTSVNNSYPVPATGLMIYDSVALSFFVYDGVKWSAVGSTTTTINDMIEDADQDTKVYLEEGVTDDKIKMKISGTDKLIFSSDQSFRSRIEFPNNGFNIALGSQTLSSNVNGHKNIAIGTEALFNTDYGFENIAIGYHALHSNKGGFANIAMGNQSLENNDNGNNNIALGYLSLINNISGNDNIALGEQTLGFNTIGTNNIALGYFSLNSNTEGTENIAIGTQSLEANTTGVNNIGIGHNSLNSNTTGTNNLGIGKEALQKNTTGFINTAIGISALKENTNGQFNVAVGNSALTNNTSGQSNVAHGGSSLFSNTTGIKNTAVGSGALLFNSTGNGNVAIGNEAGFNETGSNKLYIENSNAGPNDALIYGEFNNNVVRVNDKLGVNAVPGIYVAKFRQNGIYGLSIENTLNDLWEIVVSPIASNPDFELFHGSSYRGQFDYLSGDYSSSSDRKLKENINNFTNAIDRIKLLGHAKTYNYKADPDQETKIGFIAQDLLEVFPEFVNVPNPASEREHHHTVNYAGLSSVALSAIYEQQEIIERQEQLIESQGLKIKTLEEKWNVQEDRLNRLEALIKE